MLDFFACYGNKILEYCVALTRPVVVSMVVKKIQLWPARSMQPTLNADDA